MKEMKRHSSLGTLIAFLHRASLLSKAICNKADSWPWALELREEAGPSWYSDGTSQDEVGVCLSVSSSNATNLHPREQ